MPKFDRPDVTRADIAFPPELLARIDQLAGPRGRNSWIIRELAKAAKMRLSKRKIAPPTGRPKKLPANSAD